MLVEVTKTKTEKAMVEVTLPLYREHRIDSDYGDSVIYTRIDLHEGKLRCIDVHIRSEWSSRSKDEISIEVDDNYHFDGV